MIPCKNCGRELNSDTDEKCSYCGVSLNDSPFSSFSPAATSNYNKPHVSGTYQIQRPTGISILSVLLIISGLFSITGIISGLLGIIPFVMGIISIVIGWGMWTSRGWAWSGFIILILLGTVLNIIRFIPILFLSQSGQMLSGNNAITVILGSIVGISIGIGLSVLFIYYIYRPHVKDYFNKS